MRSMHLVIPSPIDDFYYIQQSLIQTLRYRVKLSQKYTTRLGHWKRLYQSMENRFTYLAEIVYCLATDLGFIDASGICTGRVWLDPNSDGEHFVWHVEYPPDIVVVDLVRCDNQKGRITNSDLELAALVTQEVKFRFADTIRGY